MNFNSLKLSTFLTPPPPTRYCEWKPFRESVVKLIGSKLVALEEIAIRRTFVEWETAIRQSMKNMQFDNTQQQMEFLLMVSILHYFQRNLNIARSFVPTIMKIIQSRTRDIYMAATKVLHWIAHENNEGPQLLIQPVNNAFEWLRNGDVTMKSNALWIFKSAKCFPELNIVHRIISNFDLFFQAAKSENERLRLASVELISFVFRSISFRTYKTLVNTCFTDCMRIINSTGNSPAKAHGPLLILQVMYEVQPAIFADSRLQLIASLVRHTASEFEALSIDAFKFWLNIGSRNIFFNDQLNSRILDSLFDKCTNARDTSIYYSILQDAIEVLGEAIDLVSVVDFLQDVLSDDDLEDESENAFKVLACMIKKYPNTNFNHSVFKRDYLCDDAILCLELMPDIEKSVLNMLTSFVRSGITSDNDPQVTIQALKIARIFDAEIFETSEQLYDALLPLTETNDEELMLEVVKTMELVDNEDSMEFLLSSALYDQHESVRHESLHLLHPSSILAFNPLLPQILSDLSIETKRTAIELVSDMIEMNPFDLKQPIISMVEDIFSTILSIDNISTAASLASLLPLVVKKAKKVIKPFAQSIIVACAKCIYPDLAPIKYEQCVFTYDVQLLKKDIKEVPMRDGFAYVSKIPEKSALKGSLYAILNQKEIDKRDGFLLQTLSEFPKNITPFLDTVLMLYYKIFTERSNVKLLEIAADTLTKIAAGVGTGLNLRMYTPQFIPVLTKLLKTTMSQKLSIAILKLLGTAVDNFDLEGSNGNESNVQLGVDIINPSYYTDFVLTHLSKFFDTPNEEMFEAVTRIFESAPEDAAKFIDKVIKLFIRTINDSRKQQRSILFAELEQITASCPRETIPYLPELTNCLLKNVSDTGCMLLCSCLSFTFKNTFTPYAKLLYIAGLNCLSKLENFAETLKFLAFAVCFQNQPLSLLIDVLDELTQKEQIAQYMHKVSKNLCFIVQTIDVSLHQARIARIVHALLELSPNDSLVKNLAFSLVLTCHMHPSVIRRFIPKEVDTKELMESIKANNYELRNNKYITLIKMDFLPTHIDIPIEESAEGFFDELKEPTELGIGQWLDNICQVVVTCSPSPVIRSCNSFIQRQKKFKYDLFPVAFLSCWEYATDLNMDNFSSIISSILRKHNTVHPKIFELAEITDRALLPMSVSYLQLARKCEIKELSLYFLQKEHLRDPSNFAAVDMLLALNSAMGRNISARGLLAQTNTKREKGSTAKWYEWLGDWQHALELYDETHSTITNRVKCYAHLHQWERIRDLEPEFWKMTKKEKESNVRHFAWAFYSSEDWQKISKMIPLFPADLSLNDLVFRAVFALKQGNLKKSTEFVEKGFDLLSKDCSVFSGGDVNKATAYLSAAQLFVEISEACKMIKEKNISAADVWTRRMNGFRRNGDTWIKLIDIRSLIIPPDSNYGIYFKLFSVLRDEGRWDLIDSYFNKLEKSKLQPNIVLSKAKIEWTRGNHEKAIQCLEEVRTQEGDPIIMSKIDRMLALYISQEHPDQMLKVADLYAEAKELNMNNKNAWTGWAYTNHILSQTMENSDDYALAAVSGFMGAARIDDTVSVEYLILMFAIFFKVRDSSKISNELIEDLLALPPEMIVQVIPQITIQIAHQDPVIRKLVHDIIIRFGDEHFQCIIFPLGMYTWGKPEEDKAAIARDIIATLQKKHTEEMEDAEIFVRGMLDAALTPFERWVIALDEAAYAKRERNTKKINSTLNQLFQSFFSPKSDLERRFKHIHGAQIQQAYNLFRRDNPKANAQMWEILKRLYEQFIDKTNKLEIILLSRVNEELATKRNFTISIPGTYSVKHSSPLIQSVEPGLQVLGTQQHPRVLNLVSNEGKKVKFLLKGSEDLRLDQRVMQFFNLVNSLLRHDAVMGDYKSAQIVEYPIIPLAPSAGLITWVENADTLHHMICDMRDACDKSQVPEFEVLNEKSNGMFGQLTSLQRLEMFYEIADVCDANEIRDYLWYRAPNARQWVQTQNNFCITTALMSMIGYIIGLGDRHPSNIMVQRDTGRVIHIDFGDTFETTINRATFPEKVPFRLTRMIVHALDGGSVEGMFRSICKSTMTVLRGNKSSLVALLEIFIHEPLEENSYEKTGHLTPTQCIERVSDKLNGKDMMEEFGRVLNVSEQVDALIRDASDCSKYVTHYTGWCPYW